MKITKSKLRQVIKEEFDSEMGHETVADRKWADNPNRTQDAHGQKAYLVTVGYGSTAVGIFSSMEAAEEAVLKDIEYEHREMGDTAVKREDYDIDELELDKGRS